LIQVGVEEVVYAHNYAGSSMDGETERLLKEAGVKLRQFTAPEATEWMEGVEEGRQGIVCQVPHTQVTLQFDNQDASEEVSSRDL
jgi:deoxycytidylate deaminase